MIHVSLEFVIGINNNDKQFSSIVIHRLKMFNAEITRVCDTHIV